MSSFSNALNIISGNNNSSQTLKIFDINDFFRNIKRTTLLMSLIPSKKLDFIVSELVPKIQKRLLITFDKWQINGRH